MQRSFGLAVFAFTIAAFVAPTHAQESVAQTAATGSWVVGDQIYVVIPADRKSIYAFSTFTSEFSRMVLDAPLPADAKPVVGAKVAAIQAGRTIYAIGANGHGWSRLDLPADGLHFNVDHDAIRVSNDDVFYIFSSGSKRWAGVDLRNGGVLPLKTGE